MNADDIAQWIAIAILAAGFVCCLWMKKRRCKRIDLEAATDEVQVAVAHLEEEKEGLRQGLNRISKADDPVAELVMAMTGRK